MNRLEINKLVNGELIEYTVFNSISSFITVMAKEMLNADYYNVSIEGETRLITAYNHYSGFTERIHSKVDVKLLEAILDEIEKLSN